MTTALSSAPAVLSHLRSSGFSVTADRRGLWVRPRSHLTLDQVVMIEQHRDALIDLVADADLLREKLREAEARASLAETRASMAEIQARMAEIARRSQQTTIPPAMLDRLIRLCHPDHHAGADAANKATAWLLSIRQRNNT